MKAKHKAILFLFVVIVLGGWSACAAPEQTGTPSVASTLTMSPCLFGVSASGAPLKGDCGTLSVYEDRVGQAGRRIDLAVARLPALSRKPQADALFIITGGPGQSAWRSYTALGGAFDLVNRERDVVLVDQRGTGKSNALKCPPFAQGTGGDAGAELEHWLSDCLAHLDADPRFYTTELAVADLDEVRAALGYTQINVYGVSYGTRVALDYVRRYPEHTRTLILDGVVPADELLGPEIAPDAQRGLDLLFARCAAEDACARAFPHLRAELAGLLARVAENPVALIVTHPINGTPVKVTLTRGSLAAAIRLMSYTAETAVLLPVMIHHAYTERDYSRFAGQVLLLTDGLSEDISQGMAYSVVCAEDVPWMTPEQVAQAGAGTYLGAEQGANLFAVCATWPRGTMSADFHTPVVSDVPVLLMSGELDPITPPENAARVARTLSHSLSLVVAGQGHNVIMRGCMPRIATRFIEQGQTDGLDTTCLDKMTLGPFFTDFSGPP